MYCNRKDVVKIKFRMHCENFARNAPVRSSVFMDILMDEILFLNLVDCWPINDQIMPDLRRGMATTSGFSLHFAQFEKYGLPLRSNSACAFLGSSFFLVITLAESSRAL